MYTQKVTLDSDSTEREYLMKSRLLTWEYVDVFEKCFRSAALNDEHVKNEEDESSSSHKDGDLPGGTYIFINPSLVSSVRVMLSSVAADLHRDSSSGHDETYDQSLVDSHSGSTSTDDHHTCTICHKHFGYKSKLTVTMRSHTGDKPIKRPQCEGTFAHKGGLKQHLLLHSIVGSRYCQ